MFIKLFKAVQIPGSDTFGNETRVTEWNSKTFRKGYLIAPSIIGAYTDKRLTDIVSEIDKTIGLTPEQMNSSFHKSWGKVATAPIKQLIIEQLVHYMTTYGFEALGIYNESSVFIPKEALEVPEFKGFKMAYINGYTEEQLSDKLSDLLYSGVALKDDSVKEATELVILFDWNEESIHAIQNREVKISVYKHFGMVPNNAVEFLRYVIASATDETLMIKNEKLIAKIIEGIDTAEYSLWKKFEKTNGLIPLAEIFNRFKPLFLAFKKYAPLRPMINKISKLSKKYHKPTGYDYLNDVTNLLKTRGGLNTETLETELEKANTFRKIRLAYALKFRTTGSESIVYRIRNGSAWATEFEYEDTSRIRKALKIVTNSIVEDVRPNVEGKKIYIPSEIKYALPASEKQFTGYVPSGTRVEIPANMIFGVWWKNCPDYRVDIDLSLTSIDGKIGWDGGYRSTDRDVLFSGDVTDAPKGASELFWIKTQCTKSFVLFANYFNFVEGANPEMKILVGTHSKSKLSRNYMIDPNELVASSSTVLDVKQKMLGLIISTTNRTRFIFCETNLGNRVTSSSASEMIEHSREYMLKYYENSIVLNDILFDAGAIITDDPSEDDIDIDLSMESLETDSIIKLLI